MTISLAFLAPDLITAAVDGRTAARDRRRPPVRRARRLVASASDAGIDAVTGALHLKSTLSDVSQNPQDRPNRTDRCAMIARLQVRVLPIGGFEIRHVAVRMRLSLGNSGTGESADLSEG
jgi:hypothetical protein